MARSNAEDAPRCPNDPALAMDAKLMVATDSGDVNKLKELLKKEDAMAMVVVTATSKKPSKDDQSCSGDIDPMLLGSACEGSLKVLNDLLKKPPIPEYQESLRDAEEGIDHQPAAGAFLKGVTPNGDTALHVNENESPEIVKLLMDADTELAHYPADSISPMYLAILLGKDTIALTLYVKSCGKLSYSGPDGQNALHAAVLRATNTVMIEMLLNWNKGLATKVDKHGSTPLHFASSLHNVWRSRINLDIATKVFEANPAAAYQADHNGLFPIHVAASIGTRRTIEYFLKKSPKSAGLRNGDGRTFLHVLVEEGRSSNIVSFICPSPEHWILNTQDKDGNTAMHLAIKSGMYWMCCALLGNKNVQLNLSNNDGETPLDLSRRIIPRGTNYFLNSNKQIYRALKLFGAEHSGLRRDCIEATYIRPLNKEEEDKESEKLKDATQTFIVGAVLIATVAFGAIFAPPGGYRADDHANGGTPTLSGRYIFDAYIMATALALLCSSVATIGLMISGTSLVDLRTRRNNITMAVFFMYTSLTSMAAAFSLSVYMVLAPVNRSTAIAIFAIIPLVQLYKNLEQILKAVALARPLLVRKGRIIAMAQVAWWVIFLMSLELWPLVVITAWAGFARIRIHH